MNKDVVIIGAGAAGLMCAIEAGKRGRSVLVLDHARQIGKKIRISGGGRCNFTNRNASPANFISQNPHFCKSALARFTPTDFISLINKHSISFHERNHGQLFCDDSADQIVRMLTQECKLAGVEIQTECEVHNITKAQDFQLQTTIGPLTASSLVIATGGLSIPKSGATNFGLKAAEQFGLNIIPSRPGLVPLKFASDDFKPFLELSGISVDAEVHCNGISFRENILFTHRGLSGPAILQISSYWIQGDSLSINLFPGRDILALLHAQQQSKKQLLTILDQFLPARFNQAWFSQTSSSKPMNRYSPGELKSIAAALTHWLLTPTGTEGYEKAEVTVGGVDTGELSSKTMESKKIPGLYFIGELVDVTGWLGGYNFQWAWSSGWAAGQAV
ncbi:MAG: NAD(P)/FAD-dependent oxidoreductase [Ignavibacteriae bacterium]|nr:MAG: NAD(P)/FAD-dependent oxidoreductase [Ignavibacteriota bacterium]